MTVAGEGQVPVGELLGRGGAEQPRRSRWRAIAHWRDWSIPVKLAAVTLVPIVIALALGITTIANQVGRSDSYQRIDRFVALGSSLRTLTDAVQHERTLTVELLTQGTSGGSAALDAARRSVDAATGPLAPAIGRAVELDGGVAGPGREATDQLGRIARFREQVAAGELDPVQAVTGYSDIVSALLKLDTALVAGISDDAIGGTPSALHDVEVAKEEVSQTQALIGFGITRGSLTPNEVNQVRTADVRLTDRLADFRAAADQQQRQVYDTAVVGPTYVTRDQLVKTVLGERAGGGTDPDDISSALRSISPQQWTEVSNTVAARMGEVSKQLGDQLTASSSALVEDASSGAGLLAVLLFGALVLTAAVVFLINRQLLRSLRTLRAGALDVADRQLPAAVQNIQEGRAQTTNVQPVPVESNDEIGEVARAFDAVHSQALRLAVEQAAMRTGYGSVFVNLSRRSQSLVQRQLQMIERLERDEEDADQLATLFQLDHLATRMRRNNENLMVLSGAEPGRRSGQPVTTTDVLRAAVSEIEQYQRVVVQPPPQARVVGYAASDLMRLVAELLDNATAFSAPGTQVTVASRFIDTGALSIDILDKGIGMNEAEVAEANNRLTEAASVDLATSRRMGLFVVGRLASRHHIGVMLHGGKDIAGVRATVTVPADLVVDAQGPASPAPSQGPSTEAPQPAPGSLPRRQRPVNGASRSVNGRPGVPPPSQGTPLEHKPAEEPRPPEIRAANGLAGLSQRPPSDVEISGTALFSPIAREEPAPEPEPKEPEKPAPLSAAEADAALPRGKELFEANGTALTDWWNAATSESDQRAAAAPPPPARPETTPIFDEMLSAWFRSAEPDAGESDDQAAPAQGDTAAGGQTGWDFVADANRRTVEAVSRTEPTSFTSAGLPQRRRGEQLLPGGVPDKQPETPAPSSDLPVRDPANVRGRLSSFQQGVNRGRQAKQEAAQETTEAAQSPATPASSATPAPTVPVESPGPLPSRKPPAAPNPPAEQAPEPPATQVTPPAAAPPAPAEPERDEDPSEVTSAWSFESDESWRTVQAVSQTVSGSLTPAGLPRRRRGEQLMPGSAPPSAQPASPRPERDAHDVRGRLTSFQQGIRRGRHQAAQPTDGNQEKREGE